MADPRVWPLEANWREPIGERYGYLTALTQALNGQEHRAQLKRFPIGSLEFSILCDSLLDAQLLQGLLFQGQAEEWIVPLWQYQQALGADVTPTAVTVTVETDAVPWQDSQGLGYYALLWRSPQSWELIYVASAAAGVLNLSSEVQGTWSATGTIVVPARVGVLGEVVNLNWLTASVLEARVRFALEGTTRDVVPPFPAGTTGFIIIDGMVQPIT